MERKNKVWFLKVFDNPLSKYLIFTRISCMQWLFWVVYQNKKGSGTSFWCTFSAWFFHKNVPYLILYQWSKFQCHTFFPSQDIKQNVFLSSYLNGWWHHKLLSFIFNQALKQWLTGRKRGEGDNGEIWISWERKELFTRNKKHFS